MLCLWTCSRGTEAGNAPAGLRHTCRAGQQELAEACQLLELDLPVRDAAEVRQAYLRKIRVAHPDLNPFTDTTDEAVDIIEAYEAILEVSTDLGVACTQLKSELVMLQTTLPGVMSAQHAGFGSQRAARGTSRCL